MDALGRLVLGNRYNISWKNAFYKAMKNAFYKAMDYKAFFLLCKINGGFSMEKKNPKSMFVCNGCCEWFQHFIPASSAPISHKRIIYAYTVCFLSTYPDKLRQGQQNREICGIVHKHLFGSFHMKRTSVNW